MKRLQDESGVAPNTSTALQKRTGAEELLFVNKKKQKNFIDFFSRHFQHRATRTGDWAQRSLNRA
jgi:hypothetical protein